MMLLFIVSTVLAQIPADNQFYNGSIGAVRKTIVPNGVDDTQIVQAAIDEVAASGGGILKFTTQKSNTIYHLGEIYLKSNVHIKAWKGVVIKPLAEQGSVFYLGKNGDDRISNVSITCTNRSEYFTFDFSDLAPNIKSRAVFLAAVDNFLISDFNIIDNNTKFSAITLGVHVGSNMIIYEPTNGIVEHSKITTAHYGYGLVQCQTGKNILYRNLEGEGGATLRLESGSPIMAESNLVDRTINMHRIYGTKISCLNGQSALTLSPHTINNGKVIIDDVTAISCEAGAIINKGYLSKKKGQVDADGNPLSGYKSGYFSSNSKVTNMTVVYGEDAQLRNQRLDFIPCSQRFLLSSEKNVDEESFHGPSITGIVYFAAGGTDRNEGYYSVDVSGLSLQEFSAENKSYLVSNDEKISDCTANKSKGKMTAENSSQEKVTSIYPNPASENIIVTAPTNSAIYLFDVSGVLIQTIRSIQDQVGMDVSGLKPGLYIIKIDSGTSTVLKKISVL
ncbi:T9SS type A sorting domain-containing protein [Flavicella marina]|uniref:T9SS type A sorting domain-containing protein n=1 Tax=Flavicella marina TaxID=1475951 RepID=UPI00186B0E04|nr:T9SS type A sorting domain-containing protein [Flavicella marina]